jgi:hypothetical protein
LHGKQGILQGRDQQRKDLLEALCQDKLEEWAAWGTLPLSKEILETLVSKAQELQEETRQAECDARKISWRAWVKGETEGAMHNLFKYLKNGAASLMQLGLWTDAEGHVHTGKAALLHSSEAAWWPLWRPEDRSRVRAADFARYETLPVRPMTGKLLSDAAWQSAIGKAPGGDGWSLKRMRQWPQSVWCTVAALITMVESIGRWPEALRGGIICLTPKGGVQASAQTPLEARPIVLLAQLYRLWAAVRATDLTNWVDYHKLSPVGKEGSQASEELGAA